MRKTQRKIVSVLCLDTSKLLKNSAYGLVFQYTSRCFDTVVKNAFSFCIYYMSNINDSNVKKSFFVIIVNQLETEGKNAIDTPLSPSVVIPNSYVLGKCGQIRFFSWFKTFLFYGNDFLPCKWRWRIWISQCLQVFLFNILAETEETSMVEPASLEDPKVIELMNVSVISVFLKYLTLYNKL